MARRVATAFIVALLSCVQGCAAIACPDIGDALWVHGDLRNTYGRGAPLQWDAELGRSAQVWADRVAVDCQARNDPNAANGRNVFTSTTPGVMRAACKTAALSWASTAQHFRFDAKQLYSGNAPSIVAAARPFLNMAWFDTKRVGCSVAQRGTCVAVVCDYRVPLVEDDVSFRANIGGPGKQVSGSNPSPEAGEVLPPDAFRVGTFAPGMCLWVAQDVAPNLPAALMQKACSVFVQSQQMFVAQKLSPDVYRIMTPLGRCWGVLDSTPQVGTPVVAVPCRAGMEQAFVITRTPDLSGWFTMRPMLGMPNLCVQVVNGATTAGAWLGLGRCSQPSAPRANEFLPDIVNGRRLMRALDAQSQQQ